MIGPLFRIVLVSAAAILAGLPLAAPRRRPTAGDLAAAWTLALGNAAVLALAAGLLGLTLSPAALLLLLIAPGAAAALLGRAPRHDPANGDPPGGRGDPAGRGGDPANRGGEPAAGPGAPVGGRDGRPLVVASRVALGCALAALLVKMTRVPLWSWDHFAIWGVKARSMLADGHLRLDFLRSLYQSRADHPLGVPMSWLVLTLGETPSPAIFKVLHALFALALVAALRAAVRRATSSPALANAAAAFLAVSPLLWDSEAMGLAEVPLALWATVSLLLLSPGPAATPSRPWVPGLALGFLPWIKQEGLVLGLLLLAAALLPMLPMARARRGGAAAAAAAQLCGPALALMAGALAIQKRVLPPGVSFFLGDWWRRGLDRLPLILEIQRRCLSLLLQPDWLGFWIVLAALTAVAVARRHGMALAVIAIVWIQVFVYELTAVFTYLPPLAHLEASFFRICAALVPIGLLGMATLSRTTSWDSDRPRNGFPE